MSLSKKMLREIKINRTQFIAIFLMAFIGIFAYSGIYAEYYGLEQTSNEFYAQTNLADGWVYNTDFDESTFDKISDFTTDVDKQAVIQSVADMENQPDITLHFIEKGTISKFYTTEGKKFNASDASGVWLDTRFAEVRNLHVGDTIKLEFNNQTIKKEIKGLGYSPEYVFETSPSSLTPDFSTMGFAYLSARAYPEDIKYDTLLVKYNISDKQFREKLDDSIDYLSFTKQNDHLSVSKFADEMAQHKMIGDVFPIVFILVTFLTLLTTMTRIVSHQRTQIGILKAVGFKDKTIILHYISYGFWPVIAGAVLGLITGPMIIPQMFYPTMTVSYSMPSWNPGFDMSFVYIAISLVVSSIMIGIITYISVLERTKEIGILRSIGASKRDISRVFNAETVIVGFVAGILGVGLSYLLTIPINIIIAHLTEVPMRAQIPYAAAGILVIISILLTLIAGLFPSRIAAKKDPVIALRTE